MPAQRPRSASNGMDILQGATCSHCHLPIPPEVYFCPNCGKSLKEKPSSTSITTQIKIYVVSALLPPFGLGYVWKYYKQPDRTSRQIAVIALVLTVVMTIFTIWIATNAIESENAALKTVLNGNAGLY